MNNKLHFVSIGLSGTSTGTASRQKLQLMARAIIEGGDKFSIISHSFVKKSLPLNESYKHILHGINYVNTSPFIYSPSSIIKKVYGKTLGFFKELLLVISLNRKNNLDGIFIYTMSFSYLSFWGIICKIIKIPVSLIYFELRSSVPSRKGFFIRLNDYLLIIILLNIVME
ncbi:MAG: hypothetical protein HC831_13810 [Chloroflexia bacterium]|nr:hypothetical protein [Bacteroidales bacterium]NJO89894.1 hypothetical protein [Chloroflexia bacterium]